MPLQNRVHPNGELFAVSQRGTMLGNRGGKFHRDDQTLGRRRWATHHWICCELHYKGMHHEAMGKGYTSLFFLDEVTALAAGHRPCFFCRRAEAKQFVSLSGLNTMAVDDVLHRERLRKRPIPEAEEEAIPFQPAAGRDVLLPDGAMVLIDEKPFAVKGPHLLRWSFDGYTAAMARTSSLRAQLLTPPTIVTILTRGYQPRWHESAL